MTDALYTRAGDVYTPTDFVTGPWDPDMSHGGPPAALLISAIARSAPAMGITRVTYEIPRPIPKAPMTLEVDEVRGGSRVRMVDAALVDRDGTVLMTARAWMIRLAEGLPTADPFPLPFAPRGIRPPPIPVERIGIHGHRGDAQRLGIAVSRRWGGRHLDPSHDADRGR